jgi:hypothetical protein
VDAVALVDQQRLSHGRPHHWCACLVNTSILGEPNATIFSLQIRMHGCVYDYVQGNGMWVGYEKHECQSALICAGLAGHMQALRGCGVFVVPWCRSVLRLISLETYFVAVCHVFAAYLHFLCDPAAACALSL